MTLLHYLSTSVPGDWVLVYEVGSGTGQRTAQMFNLQRYQVIGITSWVKILDFDSAEAEHTRKIVFRLQRHGIGSHEHYHGRQLQACYRWDWKINI